MRTMEMGMRRMIVVIDFIIQQFNYMFGKLAFNKQKQPTKSIFNQPTVEKTKPIKKKEKKPKVQSLEGSKFRMINELLYTSTSTQAVSHFQNHQHDYETYHQGFRHQAQKWAQNPVHSIIKHLKNKHQGQIILDLGCGDALIHDELHSISTVRSFDLVSRKQHIEVADIASLPVPSSSADVSVFCLSLMGLNYIEFIYEAKRVLKKGGLMIVAEVQSRCKEWNKFIRMIESIGFSNIRNKTNNFFRIMHFTQTDEHHSLGEVDIKSYSREVLGGCVYKKR